MIAVTPGIKSFTVTFSPSSDIDCVGYVIHASQSSGFTPSSSNLLSNGPDTKVVVPTTMVGNIYVKVAPYDTFEDLSNINFSGLNYSAEYVVTVSSNNPLDTVPPAVPTGVLISSAVDTTGQSDTSSLSVSWDAVIDTDQDLNGYSIQIKKGSATTYTEYTVDKSSSSITVSGLTPSVQYSARVASFDRWGNISAYSGWASTTTAVDTATPVAPSSVLVSSGIAVVSIFITSTKSSSWDKYEIQLSPSATFSSILYSTYSTLDINSIQVASGTYYTRVRCISRAGISSSWTSSSPASVTVDTTPNQILSVLSGQLTSSQLHSSLSSRINLIDAPSTGLVSQISTANNNISTLQTQVASLTVVPFNSANPYSVGQLVSYGGLTYKCILATSAPSAVPTNTTYWAPSEAASLSAMIAEETSTRVTADSALADALTLTSSTINGQTTAIAVHAQSINGLEGQYSVKIDSNGRVIGFGLSSGSPNSADSEFLIIADKFQVVAPSIAGSSPVIPFTVGTVGGTSSVVISKAFIGDASIDTARIDTLDIGSAKVTGTLNVNRLNVNDLFANSVAVVSGNQVTSISAGALSTGSIGASTEITVGSDAGSYIKLSGTNHRLEIRKSGDSFDKVQIGKLQDGTYGIDIKNSAGQSIFSSSDGNIDGARVSNLYVNGNVVTGGSITIGAANLTYANGATIQSLMPASANANNTATILADTGTLTINSALTINSLLTISGNNAGISAGLTGLTDNTGNGLFFGKMGSSSVGFKLGAGDIVGGSGKGVQYDSSTGRAYFRGTLNANDILASNVVLGAANIGSATIDTLHVKASAISTTFYSELNDWQYITDPYYAGRFIYKNFDQSTYTYGYNNYKDIVGSTSFGSSSMVGIFTINVPTFNNETNINMLCTVNVKIDGSFDVNSAVRLGLGVKGQNYSGGPANYRGWCTSATGTPTGYITGPLAFTNGATSVSVARVLTKPVLSGMYNGSYFFPVLRVGSKFRLSAYGTVYTVTAVAGTTTGTITFTPAVNETTGSYEMNTDAYSQFTHYVGDQSPDEIYTPVDVSSSYGTNAGMGASISTVIKVNGGETIKLIVLANGFYNHNTATLARGIYNASVSAVALR